MPVPLFDQVSNLAQTMAFARRFCLIFNLDYLETLRGDFRRVEQQLLWLSTKTNIVVGLVSNSRMEELHGRFDGAPLVLIGENGFVIEGRDYSWEYPALQQTRVHLQQVLQELQTRLGAMLAPRNYTYSPNELWLKIAVPDKNTLQKVMTAFHEIDPPGLELLLTNGLVQIAPRLKWDRGQAVLQVIQTAGSDELFSPKVIYFGGDDQDETVYKLVNSFGWSVTVRACPTQNTNARYSLQNLIELNKFLFWLNAN